MRKFFFVVELLALIFLLNRLFLIQNGIDLFLGTILINIAVGKENICLVSTC